MSTKTDPIPLVHIFTPKEEYESNVVKWLWEYSAGFADGFGQDYGEEVRIFNFSPDVRFALACLQNPPWDSTPASVIFLRARRQVEPPFSYHVEATWFDSVGTASEFFDKWYADYLEEQRREIYDD